MRDRIEHQLDAMLLDMASQKRPSAKNGQIGDFRVSSMPFCPLRELLFTERTDSFSMSFYTTIGTAFHENAQTWLARSGFSGKIFSCWKCPRCGHLTEPMFKPTGGCSCGCNEDWLYEEITIKYRGLSGHVDLVVELLPGKFVVVDFKTTNLTKKKQRAGWQNEFPASRSSITQISCYSTLLRKLFKLNIVAWCLVYIDRGDVIRTEQNYHKVLRQWTPRKHTNMLQLIDRACDHNRTLRRLEALLKGDSYSPQAVKLLKHMVVNRPCKCDASYNEWMGYKFSKYPDKGTRKDGQCLLKKACLTNNRAAYVAVEKLL